MKMKIIALLSVFALVLVFSACGGNTEATTAPTEETTATQLTTEEASAEETTAEEATEAEETTAADMTVAATFAELFKAEAVKEGATTNTIATAFTSSEAVAFMPMVQDMEAGYLAGFDADITGFEACTAFMPMIGTIPFVSYVFELEADADKDAFVATLNDNANLRWNICTAAEEIVVETVDNFVFVIMAPLSFEQPEEEGEVEGEVEGEIGGMEGELDLDTMFPNKYKLVLNSNNDLIARITEKQDDKETVELLIAQVYDMALMNLRPLTPEETQEFSRRSIEIMTKIL